MRKQRIKLLMVTIAAVSAIVLLLFCAGLWAKPSVDAREATEEAANLTKEKIGNLIITSLTVKGHQYLFFENPSYPGLGGVLHDPECTCHTNTEN